MAICLYTEVALALRIFEAPKAGSPAGDVILDRVRSLALTALAYWRQVSQDLGKAAFSLASFLRTQRRLYWKRPPWRGVPWP